MALPTPSYNLTNFPNVYEPSEDTHLFLDALEREQGYIVDNSPLLACEVGSGSGILISALATVLGSSCAYFTTDINSEACQATLFTSKLNHVSINPVGMNLTSMFRCRFDLILFNPPYVVTETKEIKGRGLNIAYAGGTNGRDVIDIFIQSLPNVLNHNGTCYLLLLKENDVNSIRSDLKGLGFKSNVVLERKIPGEHLYVCKFFRC